MLISMASRIPRSNLFLVLPMILKFVTSGGSWCSFTQCSRIEEYGAEPRTFPVRSLTPWCSAIRLARLQVVWPM